MPPTPCPYCKSYACMGGVPLSGQHTSIWYSCVRSLIIVPWQRLVRGLSTPVGAKRGLPREESAPRSTRIGRSNPPLGSFEGYQYSYVEERVTTHPTTIPVSGIIEPIDPSRAIDVSNPDVAIENIRADGFTFNEEQSNTLYIARSDNTVIVKINLLNGEITLGEDIELSEAATSFWETVSHGVRTNIEALESMNETLIKGIEERNDVISRLTQEIEQLKMVGTCNPVDNIDRFDQIAEEI